MIPPLLALLLPPAPPIVSVDGPISTFVLTFRPGPARCGGGEERLLAEEPPLPQISGWGPPPSPAPAPIRLRFRIDSTGRPLGIEEEPRAGDRGPYYDSRETVAAFAASRFRPGAERADCTIAYDIIAEPVETADRATLYRFVALQPRPGGPVGRLIFDRTKPPGSTCFDDARLNVRLRAYPAFEEIPQAPGTLSYSFLGFDLDSAGRPQDVRLLGSAGNDELDRQSLDAVRRSRFSPIAKRGCTYTYWRRQTEPMQAPESPSPDSFRPDTASCPKDGSEWAYMPPLSFPREFERRAIEGWAIVKFDVAPWGGIGNAQVLAAEPARPFGEQAVQILAAARKPPSDRGYTGCVTRVLFRMSMSGSSTISEP